MHRNRQRADATVKLRCAVLKGIDTLDFVRWRLRDRKLGFPVTPQAEQVSLASGFDYPLSSVGACA